MGEGREISVIAGIWIATLCRLRLGLGLGGPWVAQAWPKGHPSVTHGPSKGRFEEAPLFATKEEKRGLGGRSGDREIARHRRDRKCKTLPLINTDHTDQNKARQIPPPRAAVPHECFRWGAGLKQRGVR